jgi:hypothetical protein
MSIRRTSGGNPQSETGFLKDMRETLFLDLQKRMGGDEPDCMAMRKLLRRRVDPKEIPKVMAVTLEWIPPAPCCKNRIAIELRQTDEPMFDDAD